MESIAYKQIRELFLGGRRRDAHKGDFGRLLIVAGSYGMAGAAVLCARGALRSGAGLVTLCAPDELNCVLQTAVPEAMFISRAFSDGGGFTGAISPEQLAVYDAIAIGPGLGTSREARETVFYLLENFGGKFVLDADALNILAGEDITLDPDTIITPHPGEAAKLLGASAEVVDRKREASAAALAEKYGCTVALKGADTLVARTRPTLRLAVNQTGNPGMATGGSGDVLTGVIASFLAQGMDVWTAASAGVYIHGLAGDVAAAEYGEYGLTAGDLPEGVARAIKLLAAETPNV